MRHMHQNVLPHAENAVVAEEFLNELLHGLPVSGKICRAEVLSNEFHMLKISFSMGSEGVACALHRGPLTCPGRKDMSIQ